MDEYIDIVDIDGKPTGQKELKSVIHQKGYYHNTVHIWFYTADGEILLAQRSAKKTICPLLWDVSVAGHIDAGETIKQAAKREILEEIGIKISKKDLKKIGVYKCFQTYNNGIMDNEFHHAFICDLGHKFHNIKLQEEEVEGVKLVSALEFQNFLDDIEKENQHFIASNKAYYEAVFENILSAVT